MDQKKDDKPIHAWVRLLERLPKHAFVLGLSIALTVSLLPPTASALSAEVSWKQVCQLSCAGSAHGDHSAKPAEAPADGTLYVDGNPESTCHIGIGGGSCETAAAGGTDARCHSASATTDSALGGKATSGSEEWGDCSGSGGTPDPGIDDPPGGVPDCSDLPDLLTVGCNGLP